MNTGEIINSMLLRKYLQRTYIHHNVQMKEETINQMKQL